MNSTAVKSTTRSFTRLQLIPIILRRNNASLAPNHNLTATPSTSSELATTAEKNNSLSTRNPRSIQALYLKPLRREAQYGIPSCDLQIRSYSLQPLEFYCDFALRAAYYLGLPAYGPTPLPRKIERWTVLKDHFIFKKAQENFERITLRRMIQIRDGNPETVQLWLAYLRKHAYYGLGMKANMWEFSELGVGKTMDISDEQVKELDKQFAHLAQSQHIGSAEKVEDLLTSRRAKQVAGLRELPTTKSPDKPHLKVS